MWDIERKKVERNGTKKIVKERTKKHTKEERNKENYEQPENCGLHFRGVVPCIFFLHSLYVGSSFNDAVCDSDCLWVLHSVECLDVNNMEGSKPCLS
jgi:hypothetical protein